MKDKVNNQICVVKKIHYQTVEDIKTISLEIQFLRKFSHPNIVKYFTTFVDDTFIYIVMEFCNGGDLGNWMEKHNQQLGNRTWSVNKNLIFEWLQMICSAMAYVHNMDILHRDLKPNNILLSIEEHSGKITPKIADFGLSYELINKSKASTRAGTMLYVCFIFHLSLQFSGRQKFIKMKCLENLLVCAALAFIYNVDVYAIGAILYELCMGPSKPATSLLLSEKKQNLLEEVKVQYGDELYILISSMCLLDPEARPTFNLVCSSLESKSFIELRSLLPKKE